MLERVHDGLYEAACDGCTEGEYVDADNIQEAADAIRIEHKWSIKRESGEWCHYCPVCQKKRTPTDLTALAGRLGVTPRQGKRRYK